MSHFREHFFYLLYVVLLIFICIGSLYGVSYIVSDDVFDAKINYVNDQNFPFSVILEVDNKVEDNLEYSIEVLYGRDNLVVGKDDFKCFGSCEREIEIDKVFFDSYRVVIRSQYNGEHYEKKLNFKIDKRINDGKIVIPSVFYMNNKTTLDVVGKLVLSKPNRVIVEIEHESLEGERLREELMCDGVCDFSMSLNRTILFGKYDLRVYLPDDVLKKNFYVKYKKSDNEKKISSFKDLFANNSLGYINYNVSYDEGDILEISDFFGNQKKVKVNDSVVRIPNGYNFVKSSRSKKGIDDFKPVLRNVNSKDDIKNLDKREVLINEGFASMNNDSFERQSLREDFNPIVSQKERVYVRENEKYVEFDNSDFQDDFFGSNKRGIEPGVYKYEKIKSYKDGRKEVEESYFTYGLISINTKKPLYKRDEVVEFLIVVLDKRGFLVDDADILLRVDKPDNESLFLSTKNYDINPTDKQGVYEVSMIADELGEYDLHAQVELEDMIVDVESFFNVVDEYPFDIIRDVPVTIDPWQGPFNNTFLVEPIEGYDGKYDFVEVFSSEFDVVDTDADEIINKGESTYLIWRDISGASVLKYRAQTPLKTPYLYYLGKSKVLYDDFVFYENRSWLFAIDPATKVCGFESPCICGALCYGGNEEGNGTIDSCNDSNTDFEWVSDIRVNNLNGSYFGVGDSVEICVDYVCEDLDYVSVGYKDASGVWNNSHLIFEDNSSCRFEKKEFCVNQTLNDYVGIHNVRGKIAYNASFGEICSDVYRQDHDDLNFSVLDKVPALQVSWDLDNGSHVGDGLEVLRGNNISASAFWDKPIRSALMEHNGNGSFINYTILDYEGNFTNYTFDTCDLDVFDSLGVVNVSSIYSKDLYFNLTGNTSPSKYFEIYGVLAINDSIDSSKLESSVIEEGGYTNFTCQVVDDRVDVSYSGVNVSFYSNSSGYLGSKISNSSGYSKLEFSVLNPGRYSITCNVSEDVSNFYKISEFNSLSRVLTVKESGSDVSVPVISDFNSSLNSLSKGGVVRFEANVSDDVQLDSVFVNVTLPNSSSYSYEMNNDYGSIYSYNFSKTLIDGSYDFFIYAYDNSSNVGYSLVKSFNVYGIQAYIGVKSVKDVYKIGESINLTSYSKISATDSFIYNESGDSSQIFYSFDDSWVGWTSSGLGDEWERGVPSSGHNNMCDDGNCLSTDLDGDYNGSFEQFVVSPVINFSGRSDVRVDYWRMLEVENGVDDSDRAYFESFDGNVWRVLYSDSVNLNVLDAGHSVFYPSEVEDKEDVRFRFSIVPDSDLNVFEGWAIDSFNITYEPRTDWDRGWHYYNSSFGGNFDKISAIKVSINVTSYDNSGSVLAGNDLPDLVFEVFNGSGFYDSYECDLDLSGSFPYVCEFVIKNDSRILNSWLDSNNRDLRVRAVNLDEGDYIEWSDVKREVVVPSVVENYGDSDVTSYLLEEFRNSSGDSVEVMHFAPIFLNPYESKELSSYWNFSVPFGFDLGNYSVYVALTNSLGDVLKSYDNYFIEDSYMFEVLSLLINPLNPFEGVEVGESFIANLSLDTSYYPSGGWCFYSINGGTNVSMDEVDTNYYEKLVSGLPDGEKEIVFYCNDIDDYIVSSKSIVFNVSQSPRINFEEPTDLEGDFVNRSWSFVNVSVNDSSSHSSFIDFNNSLLLKWSFENVSEIDVVDSSSYGRDGNISGSVGKDNFDMIRGRYGDFLGGDLDVVTTSASFLDGLDEVTFSLWINSSVNQSDRGIFNLIDVNGSDEFGLRYDDLGVGGGDDVISAYFRTDLGVKRVESLSGMQNSGWRHIVLSWKSGESIKMYVNGSLVSLSYDEGSLDGVLDAGSDLYLGEGSLGENWDGYVDEFMIFDRVLSFDEIGALYDSKINDLQNNFTDLVNSNYSYYACSIDSIGNDNCTSIRSVNVNKTLPQISIVFPQNNSKFLNSLDISINVSTSLVADSIWCELNDNGTIYYLENFSSYDWNYSFSFLDTGKYNVTCYGNDSLGNLLDEKIHYFYVLADKNVEVSKEINFVDDNLYLINLSVFNYGSWDDYRLVDFVDRRFDYDNFSILPNGNFSVNGLIKGDVLYWDLILPDFGLENIVYYVNSSAFMSSYELQNNYLVGFD